MSVLVTGGKGFIGGALVKSLKSASYTCVIAGRKSRERFDSGTNWTQYLIGVKTVVHLLGCAHKKYSDDDYSDINHVLTRSLVKQAAESGVARFFFISTSLVHGENSLQGSIVESSSFSPGTMAALTKSMAERDVIDICARYGMEYVIIRPPLVYGPGVKANFLNVMKLANSGAPLPFGAINNRRSMIYVANLVDFIIQCIDHPAAANQTFLISDGRDLSLRDLLTQLRLAMGKSARLIPAPAFLFVLAGKLFGKQDLIDRLVGDLQVNSSKAADLLEWTPPFTVEQGIQATVDAFLKSKQ